MKVAPRLTKNTITPTTCNSKSKLKQNVDGILSKLTGKTRVGKAKSQQYITFCNNKASHIQPQSPAKHKITTKSEIEGHNFETIISLEQDEKNIKGESNHGEVMSALAATLKKREIQISKSMDKLFESSVLTITETLSVYLEKEDNIINKIACEYKSRIDEHTDEKLNWLRKLRLGFEKYQLTASTLLEALDKNHSQNLRAKRNFMKDMEQIHSIHQSEIAKLYEEIDKSIEHFHKIMSIAVKETQRKPSFANQLKSLFSL
ncbi:hypothetical protein C1645_760026 [Glomus cerebriforme]|uniref:Uncharacterized protein n=1 Tax=Glomus cerebriforme TaxID=658196 RepID=A0A397T8C0_9GLOM|nr:hypothetical protein C1645_760026 [Glomus cerebriforme]